MSNTDPQSKTLGAHPNNKQLHGEVLRLRELIEAEIGKSAPHYEGLVAQIKELEKHSKRHPTIGHQLSVLHAKATAMEAKMNRFQAFIDGINPDEMGTMKLRLTQQELDRMLSESEEFATVITEFGTVKQSIADLESKVDRNHAELKGEISSTNGRLGLVTHRVHLLETIRDKVPWLAIIGGLIVGLIVWLVWVLPAVFMTPDIPLPDGTVAPGVPDPIYNSWGWKLAIGVAVAIAAIGLFILIGMVISAIANSSRRRRDEKAAQEQQAPPVPEPDTPVTSSIVEDETPTRPYDSRTPVGASSGTH